jgi:hypothetical protein
VSVEQFLCQLRLQALAVTPIIVKVRKLEPVVIEVDEVLKRTGEDNLKRDFRSIFGRTRSCSRRKGEKKTGGMRTQTQRLG